MYNRVGTQVLASAVELVEYSKKSIIGDGTSSGFVAAVLANAHVEGANINPSFPVNDDAESEDEAAYGTLIYIQSGPQLLKRLADILPGDIVSLKDAVFKVHHKGLSLGIGSIGHKAREKEKGSGGETGVGVVQEFDEKKRKVWVWRAVSSANTYPVRL